jgi:hypothetical protein
MKTSIIYGAFVAIMSLLLLGCSNSNDPWSKLPKDCTARVMTPKSYNWEPVPCSLPIDALGIVNESRSVHETLFGGPYQALANEDVPNQVFYNGGSIAIWYKKTEPTVVNFMDVYPAKLDFNPQAILDFMGITDMSVEAQPDGVPVSGYLWNDDPVYGNLRAYSNGASGEDEKTVVITIYGPNHR